VSNAKPIARKITGTMQGFNPDEEVLRLANNSSVENPPVGKENCNMVERAIENRVKKLKAIEAQQKVLEMEAEKLKEEINKKWKIEGQRRCRQETFLLGGRMLYVAGLTARS
jgi:hypothetical protein